MVCLCLSPSFGTDTGSAGCKRLGAKRARVLGLFKRKPNMGMSPDPLVD